MRLTNKPSPYKSCLITNHSVKQIFINTPQARANTPSSFIWRRFVCPIQLCLLQFANLIRRAFFLLSIIVKYIEFYENRNVSDGVIYIYIIYGMYIYICSSIQSFRTFVFPKKLNINILLEGCLYVKKVMALIDCTNRTNWDLVSQKGLICKFTQAVCCNPIGIGTFSQSQPRSQDVSFLALMKEWCV